jgi:hypothetical protein
MTLLHKKVGMEEEEMMIWTNLEVEEGALEAAIEEASEKTNLVVQVEVAHMVQAEEAVVEETTDSSITTNNHTKSDVW